MNEPFPRRTRVAGPRPPAGSEGEGIRLAKQVAAQRDCSRREAELLIENGAVRVDGRVVEVPGARVREGQRIEIDAAARPEPVQAVTLLLHKPRASPSTRRSGGWCSPTGAATTAATASAARRCSAISSTSAV